MKRAHEHAAALANERRGRDGGRHANDKRIATEIAAHQFDLGRFEREIVAQNERWKEATARNLETIKEIRDIYARLQTEMDIATNRDLSATLV